jgi:hypothetical protein
MLPWTVQAQTVWAPHGHAQQDTDDIVSSVLSSETGVTLLRAGCARASKSVVLANPSVFIATLARRY